MLSCEAFPRLLSLLASLIYGTLRDVSQDRSLGNSLAAACRRKSHSLSGGIAWPREHEFIPSSQRTSSLNNMPHDSGYTHNHTTVTVTRYTKCKKQNKKKARNQEGRKLFVRRTDLYETGSTVHGKRYESKRRLPRLLIYLATSSHQRTPSPCERYNDCSHRCHGVRP